MQQVNEEKMVIFENQQGFFYDIYIRGTKLGNPSKLVSVSVVYFCSN